MKTLRTPTRLRPTLSLVFSALVAMVVEAPVCGQDWITYEDVTGSRLLATPDVSVSDAEEKDYAWGDVDQDGDVDLVAVRKQPWNTPGRRRNVLFMNEGLAEGHAVNGVLVDRTDLFATAATDGGQGFLDLTNDRDVAVVDVDGDGWLDIVTSTTYGTGLPKTISHPRVYRNLRTVAGAWQGFLYEEFRTPTMPIAPNFCGLGAGDVTGDGFVDLYFVDYLNTLEDRLWINTGSGSFVDETTVRMTPAMVESAFGVHTVIADLNGDGRQDIVKDRALVAPIRISIAYNNGPAAEGFFADFETVYLGSSYHVDVGDLNSDGLLDIVIDDDGIDRYLLNQGNGPDGLANFVSLPFPPASDGFGGNIDIRDLDKDGFQDVIIADVDVDCCGCSRHTHIWRNNGDLPAVTFTEETGQIPVAARTGVHDVAVFDLNGDTWLDLVFGTCTGMSVWIAHPPLDVQFSYPAGRPAVVPPSQTSSFALGVELLGAAVLAPSGLQLHLSVADGPFVAVVLPWTPATSMAEVSLPAVPCSTTLRYYFTAALVTGETYREPIAGSLTTVAASASQVLYTTDFSTPAAAGWVVESDPGMTGGVWEVATPHGSSWNGSALAPPADASGASGGRAFVTGAGTAQSSPTTHDVDGGPTRLVSPEVAIAGEAAIRYDRWFVSLLGTPDVMTVEISGNAGQDWVAVETVTPAAGSWETSSIVVRDHLPLAATVRVRFSVADLPNDSLTEAGIDNFRVEGVRCEAFVRGDCNADGAVNVGDPISLLGALFTQALTPPCPDACDANDDAALNVADVIWMLGALFGGGPPPPAPYPECGADPDPATSLGCGSFVPCF